MTFETSKIDKVHALVAQSGGWGSVFSNYSNLDVCFQKLGKEYPCPLTGDGKTKFSFFKDAPRTGGAMHRDFGPMPDGIDVIAWIENVSKGKALDIIIGLCGGNLKGISDRCAKQFKKEYADTRSDDIDPKESARRKATLTKIAKGAQPLSGTVAETYLRSRGIQGPVSSWHDLHFHPALAYKESDDAPWIHFPGLLAIVRNCDGTPVTMHRTFIDVTGKRKAPVSRQKMLLAQPTPLDGAAVMLDKPLQTTLGGLIGVSEGIETALSVKDATGCPMWVGISDRIMEKLQFWDSVSTIVVWADIEPSHAGMRAANHIKEKWEALGKQVIIKDPSAVLPRKKVDWNDVYVELGPDAFDFVLPPSQEVA